MNQYENCIWSVGSIICPYDKDQLFSFYGFGAKVNGTVNHSFPLNFNENKPTVNGLSEIVETYKKALSSVLFSGPTLFSPIIKKTSATAISSFRSSLTITIFGVGNADFGGMEMLDADKNKLASSTNEKASRDIFQFVPFNKFAGNGVILASEVLAEIPKQVD
ncbi:hypothetical protein M9Y10_014060 [Tritrichomonas musculus]|uniref:Copine C-terminal domain-containing protein n=1 Tax=Tritrichomonas musculus TaxID=1915356 RepID=A0ABR2KZE8_9EUKA